MRSSLITITMSVLVLVGTACASTQNQAKAESATEQVEAAVAPDEAAMEEYDWAFRQALSKCMALAGFELLEKQEYDLPQVSADTDGFTGFVIAERFGVVDQILVDTVKSLDLQAAAADLDPVEQQRYLQVLYGDDGGCARQADESAAEAVPSLDGTQSMDLLDSYEAALAERVNADTEVQAIYDEWSTCVEAAGYESHGDPASFRMAATEELALTVQQSVDGFGAELGHAPNAGEIDEFLSGPDVDAAYAREAELELVSSDCMAERRDELDALLHAIEESIEIE